MTFIDVLLGVERGEDMKKHSLTRVNEVIALITLLSVLASLEPVPVRSAADPVVVRKLVDGTYRCEGMVLIVDELIGSGLHILCSNRINTSKELCTRHSSSVGKHLASDVFACIGEGVKLHEHVRLELGLRSLDFLISDLVAKTDHVIESIPHDVIKFIIRCDNINSKKTSVFIVCVE